MKCRKPLEVQDTIQMGYAKLKKSKSTVMASVVDSSVTHNMFSKVNPSDAVATAKGF